LAYNNYSKEPMQSIKVLLEMIRIRIIKTRRQEGKKRKDGEMAQRFL